MKIATWNIGGGFISSNNDLKFDSENLEYFINELKKIKPDVVCFQEIHISENKDWPKIIAEVLGFKFVETKSIAESHLKDGNKLSISIISRFPIISSKFDKLTNPNLQSIWEGIKVSSHDKGFLEVKIDYNGIPVRILSGHMVPFRKFERDFLEDDFKEIRNQIEEIICQEKAPAIICADMNFEDIQKLIPNVFKRGFDSILDDGPTTPKGRKYDKIIVSEGWIFTNSKIIQGRADHYLCFTDIELK